MIEIAKLRPEDIGRKVVYTDFGRREEGTLSSWSARVIFVKFRGPAGESCDPSDVEFAVPTETIDRTLAAGPEAG